MSDSDRLSEKSEAFVSADNGTRQASSERICVLFVGNRLMMDDGVGPAAYDYILQNFELSDNVDMFDVGCMSMDMLDYVRRYDFMMTVDAVGESGEAPGTVFRYKPVDVARNDGPTASIHDLKLANLFDAASLMGYTCEGLCYGMQVEILEPAEYTIGLTPAVEEKLPFLAESVLAELWRRGAAISRKDGKPFGPAFSDF
ncbi:MAG: hydrogenase maturation protease [Coriobacteriia bacterium]|nr:hydrogenase maturation protease [Coriobacteriia bacterium]